MPYLLIFPISGHSGCFSFFTIVNNIVVNIPVYKIISVPLIYLRLDFKEIKYYLEYMNIFKALVMCDQVAFLKRLYYFSLPLGM